MLICKVVKPLVSTNRIPDFEHKHLCVGSSAAREAAGSKSYPSDLTIVGIIDHWDPEAAKAAPAAGGGGK